MLSSALHYCATSPTYLYAQLPKNTAFKKLLLLPRKKTNSQPIWRGSFETNWVQELGAALNGNRNLDGLWDCEPKTWIYIPILLNWTTCELGLPLNTAVKCEIDWFLSQTRFYSRCSWNWNLAAGALNVTESRPWLAFAFACAGLGWVPVSSSAVSSSTNSIQQPYPQNYSRHVLDTFFWEIAWDLSPSPGKSRSRALQQFSF